MVLKHQKQSRQKQMSAGFTLVEALVSILILLTVVISPMTIASRGLQSSFFANEQMTAVFLAQEAIEEIDKLRYDQALGVFQGGGDTWAWFGNLPNYCKSPDPDGCDINLNEDPIEFVNCPAGGCTLQVNTNPASGELLYGHGGVGWEDSIYTRSITVADEGAGIASIEVTVSWGSNLFSTPREVVLQTWIYDQYDQLEP